MPLRTKADDYFPKWVSDASDYVYKDLVGACGFLVSSVVMNTSETVLTVVRACLSILE